VHETRSRAQPALEDEARGESPREDERDETPPDEATKKATRPAEGEEEEGEKDHETQPRASRVGEDRSREPGPDGEKGEQDDTAPRSPPVAIEEEPRRPGETGEDGKIPEHDGDPCRSRGARRATGRHLDEPDGERKKRTRGQERSERPRARTETAKRAVGGDGQEKSKIPSGKTERGSRESRHLVARESRGGNEKKDGEEKTLPPRQAAHEPVTEAPADPEEREPEETDAVGVRDGGTRREHADETRPTEEERRTGRRRDAAGDDGLAKTGGDGPTTHRSSPYARIGATPVIVGGVPSSSPRRPSHDLLVIGGGAAGLVAASTARRLGATVALIEARALGGDCLHGGCVPSKAFLHVAAAAQGARRLGAPFPGPLGAAALAASRRAVSAVAPHDSPERYRALGVDVRLAPARFLGGETVAAGEDILRARRIVLATGSRPRRPSWAEREDLEDLCVDTDSLWSREDLPRRLTVVGGGPSGCELAQALARLGHDVRLVEARERLLPEEDAGAADLLASVLTEEGVGIVLGARVETVVPSESGVRIAVRHRDEGASEWTTDLVLLTLGRVPTVDPEGFEALSPRRTEKGYLAVDSFLRTSVRGLYACGDATGPPQTTPVAGRQGWCAATNALLAPLVRLRWDTAPIVRVVYTDPEIATVLPAVPGEDPSRTVEIDLAEVDRALLEERPRGFLKLGLDTRGRLRRAVLVAPHAGELASELALTFGRPLGRLFTNPRAYPTYGEILARAAARPLEERWRGLPERLVRSLVALGRRLPPSLAGDSRL